MRNFLRNSVAALGVFLMSLAAVAPAFALTNPPTFSPRQFQTQQTHYVRFSVNFNSCVYSGLSCSVKVGNLPYNAFVTRIYFQTTTTWNAGTSASIGVGTNTPATNIMASTAVTSAGAGVAGTAVIGETSTGNGATPTGQDGGFDVFATITIVGALPTAGATQLVVEYIGANDGACINQPLTGPSGAC